MTCGADTLANTLLTSLTAGVDFTLPDVDLTDPSFSIPDTSFDPPVSLTNADLTQGIPGTGTGTFDVVMKSILEHLGTEFEKGRITGAEYSKVYIEALQAALGNSVQFLLGRDQAYWQAVQAQMQARIAEAQVITARVELETAKARLMAVIFEAKNQEASYALTKMKLSTESVTFCTAEYNLATMLPAQTLLVGAQKDQAIAQTAGITASTAAQTYTTANILPAQKTVLDDQHAQSVYQLANILPAQKFMLQEQGETARAQTWDTRQDGLGTVVGAIGKQKALHTQQIESYKRDAEVKAAKLFTDAWITQKTIDEGLVAPTEFANTSLNAILADIKTANSIG